MSKIKVYDNGGRTFDRYTVIIGKSIYAMSHNPLYPQGFDQYVGEIDDMPYDFPGIEEGKEIKDIKELPEEVLKAIKIREA